MSKFYLSTPSSRSPESTSSSNSSSDSLPYPTPLQRSAFLDPEFQPAAYLSTLRNRHQTLEDLRSELRQRSQLLSRELLDLVNGNYQDFLGLGTSLRGGEEKVEEVRVGLLGLRKDVLGLRGVVGTRVDEVAGLVQERESIRANVMLGRGLLEVDERLRELEGLLMVESTGEMRGGTDDNDESASDASDGEDADDEDDDAEGIFMSLSKIQRHVRNYLRLQQMVKTFGEEHPFLVAQQARFMKIRNTLLLDLSAALKKANVAGDAGTQRMLRIMGIYREMDEAKEAVQVMRGLSKR